MAVPCAVCVANPGQEVFPPLPPDQDKPFFEPHKMPPKDSENIINYRGTRVYMENEMLEVEDTEIERLDEDTILLSIFFNRSINPRAIGRDSIIIDEEPLPEETRFAFNKKGDTIRMILNMSDDYFCLKVQKIYSFDGIMLEPVEFDLEIETESEDEEEFVEYE